MRVTVNSPETAKYTALNLYEGTQDHTKLCNLQYTNKLSFGKISYTNQCTVQILLHACFRHWLQACLLVIAKSLLESVTIGRILSGEVDDDILSHLYEKKKFHRGFRQL